jgi:ABC-type transporter Mla MlaB component
VDDLVGSPGGPDLDGVLERCLGEAERARAAGFAGLRLVIEMADIAPALASAEQLARWEAMVGQAAGEACITALCQYDGRRLDAAAQAWLTAEHGGVAIDDGTVPLAIFAATEDGVRVAGELDLTTAAPFARALRARAAVSPRVEVDLEGVRFADLGGLRTVYEVARELPSDSLIVLNRTPSHARRLLRLLAWQDPRVQVHPP